jgi:hypothetical protein
VGTSRKAGLSKGGEIVMRVLFAVCSIAILFSTCAAQVRDDPYSIHLVQSLLQYPVQQGTGFSEKQVNRLGDRVSIALIKILSEQEMRNPQKIREILPLIRTAFLAPQIITAPEDKKPAVTLLLLSYLESTVQDGILKKEIVDLTDFIKDKTAGVR